MFDDVSTAYHKKVAKDRANEEGLVVNPPDLGNLPGEGEVTYASEVKEVLIPYTTREDSFHYYEERNYVNDVNRQHTEVLQTYDRELKARETYTYGQGRSSYHNHGTGDTYQYLTNQAGSVTGLTKDGQAVASSKYQLYGSTKDSTDETGNPYAYNGEARDSTGLDYLRARYYDSQAGTFLTEDSYQGELDDPLSQNRYAYVQNNPVNYTDPSGHFRKMLPDGKGPRYTQPKPLINPKDGTLYAPTTPEHEAHQIRQQQTGVYSYTYVPSYVPTSSAYEYIQQQESQLRAQAHAQAVQYRQQQIRQEYAQSTGQYGRPKAREANNLLLNWGKALKDMFTHVCDPKTTKAKDTKKGKTPSVADFRKVEEASKYGLTVEAKAKIDNMSMSDLKAKYGSVIGNYNTYTGTGYFNPLGSGENRAVIARYKQLKAEEEARIAASIAEMRKYHYTNIYKTIAETGLRPDGTPATDLEKAIAPYVPWIEPIQIGVSAFAGYQIAKYDTSISTSNDMRVKNSSPSNHLSNVGQSRVTNSPITESVIKKRIDYSKSFNQELGNFNTGYQIKNVTTEDLVLVQYKSSSPSASLKYWTIAEEANSLLTVEDYMDRLALSKDWGERNVVSVAHIPKGTEVKHAIGTAREQLYIPDPRPGGGIQYLFEEFDRSWVVETRSIP